MSRTTSRDLPHLEPLSGAVLFQEEQRYGEGRFRVLLAASLGAVLLALGALATRPGLTAEPLSLAALVLGGGAVVAMLGLTLASRLVTEVRREGLFVQLSPFHRVPRRIPFEEAARVEAITYAPWREYHGWGLRTGPTGRAYTAWGERGVLLTFPDGATLLLGSQRADQLAAALRALRGPTQR